MANLSILVVDDDPVTRALLTKRLANEDYTVETVENGLLAVDRLGQQFYDVVLTDLMMPGGVDGIGVLEAAKRINIKTEVILITAHASINNAIEAMKKGAVDYLQKPINFDELFLRLDKIRNLKMLIKNASDLREAMDVTEKTSAETIQDLEIMVADMNQRLTAVKTALAKTDIDAESRIRLVMQALETASPS
ncbi:Response regulator receiver protein [Desulfosarcina cetonica]|uniref:response regulator n=1 Tax=Desulfosarcina cetonica TaxID=90730 RepID=UPI0006CF595C|nr:response regulator [Desulfosarcina cetonica]VTR66167.1 Response regulator receiver protein [Desulfosarcina cetonica]